MKTLVITASLTALVGIAGPAAAQSLNRVDVAGAREARQDVQAVCPAFRAELPERLATAWQRVGREAELQVLFTVDGERVVQARAVSGPRAYHRWVSSAVRDLSCRNDRDTPQRFVLTVRFVDPWVGPTDTPRAFTVAAVGVAPGR